MPLLKREEYLQKVTCQIFFKYMLFQVFERVGNVSGMDSILAAKRCGQRQKNNGKSWSRSVSYVVKLLAMNAWNHHITIKWNLLTLHPWAKHRKP